MAAAESANLIMSHGFYRAFEDRYRGDRALIMQRLHFYDAFLSPFLKADSKGRKPRAIDLGCGRGEWLELLREIGFTGLGVDLDDGMLEACRELNLEVRKQDAIAALSMMESGSQTIVTAFHLVEHLPFEVLLTLVEESLRVLEPGGLLILETPNPENIWVGTVDFYQDPTHQRPIPPNLLSFVAQYSGYDQVKVVRLQESQELLNGDAASLLDVFTGASPDYAIIAQKKGGANNPYLEKAFSKSYGLSLPVLASRYDIRVDGAICEAQLRARQSEDRALQSEARAQEAESRVKQIDERLIQMERRALDAELKSDFFAHELRAMRESTSWQITAPLRKIVRYVRSIKTVVKEKARQNILRIARVVLKKPRLKLIVIKALRRFPTLENRLRHLVFSAAIAGYEDACIAAELNQTRELTDSALEVYDRIKRRIG